MHLFSSMLLSVSSILSDSASNAVGHVHVKKNILKEHIASDTYSGFYGFKHIACFLLTLSVILKPLKIWMKGMKS